MWETIDGLVSGDFFPRAAASSWSPPLVALEAGCSLAIGLSFVSLSLSLRSAVRRAGASPLSPRYLALGAFVVACSGMHFTDVVAVWYPTHWLHASVHAVAAAASVAAAVALAALVPRAPSFAAHVRLSRERLEALRRELAAARPRATEAAPTEIDRVREVLEAELDGKVRDLEELAREVAHRKRELAAALESMRAAREQAEEASRLKTDFLGLVSHELRTPLTALAMQLERLKSGKDLDDGRRALIVRMQRSAGRLADLVDSLLEYASLQSGRLLARAEEVDVGEVAAAAVEDARAGAEQKGLRIALSVRAPLPPLRSDGRLVRIVLANLVNNAVKFTDEGAVDVTVSAEGGVHRVRVSDTGPGIAPSDHARVFEPFVQLEPTQRKHTPGVGLGLAIVRDLVAALGGKVALESAEGRGSSFVVELPSST